MIRRKHKLSMIILHLPSHFTPYRDRLRMISFAILPANETIAISFRLPGIHYRSVTSRITEMVFFFFSLSLGIYLCACTILWLKRYCHDTARPVCDIILRNPYNNVKKKKKKTNKPKLCTITVVTVHSTS